MQSTSVTYGQEADNDEVKKKVEAAKEANTTILNNILDGKPDSNDASSTSIAHNTVNVQDLSEVEKAIVEKGLIFQGNEDLVSRKLGEPLNIVGKGDKAKDITVADNNIKVSKKANVTPAKTDETLADTLEIGLSETLTGIKSIGKDNNSILVFNSGKSENSGTGDTGGTSENVGTSATNSKVELKVDGVSLTFTPVQNNTNATAKTVKISNVMAQLQQIQKILSTADSCIMHLKMLRVK
ncbi:hypothetical protein [Histophilus somni]|uniref:Uncharacterized protein n=1 Tax=Histophilus somni (strain 129Pt) TaxID=205914 RepID=Q0I3W1_HISS1|nr:hypothetical protein [Histophilus somni]